MKPGLRLNIQQQLRLSPQLQQAIRLLQFSALELRAEISQQLEENPLLEWSERSEDDVSFEESTADYGARSSSDNILWETPETTTLKDYLHWQMELTPFSDTDLRIAKLLIDAIDESGYLRAPLLTLFPDQETHAEVEAVLHRIQHFDPVGVGARNLEECLQVQLNHFYEAHPLKASLDRLVKFFLPVAAKGDLDLLAKKLRINRQQCEEVSNILHALNPKPGNSFSTPSTEYIIPDAFIKKEYGKWKVSLNESYIPRIRLQETYSDLAKSTDNPNDRLYMKNKLQEARWFLRCLESRNETLFKVFTAIMNCQIDYLEHGDTAMNPLILQDIADIVDMHPSTISRITTSKYIHTPYGIVPVKYFFSSRLPTSTGETCSATAIKAKIRHLVEEENPKQPLSDHALCEHLLKSGIKIARRTVAKYREALAIPTSRERKQN